MQKSDCHLFDGITDIAQQQLPDGDTHDQPQDVVTTPDRPGTTTQTQDEPQDVLGDEHSSTPPTPPQPEQHDISGRLPTIYEDEAEHDVDTLMAEDFYDELMRNQPLCEDPTYDEDMVIHNIKHMPLGP